MNKRIDRKYAATLILIFAATGQVFAWGRPAGHSFLFYAIQAVVAGSVIAALTMWITFKIFTSVEKRGNRH
jgi:hypothetical protein